MDGRAYGCRQGSFIVRAVDAFEVDGRWAGSVLMLERDRDVEEIDFPIRHLSFLEGKASSCAGRPLHSFTLGAHDGASFS
jgi:hypothetical protein